MIVYYSEYSMFVVGDYVPKWLPKWASQLKTIMSDLRLRNGNFPFQNRKGCELGLYSTIGVEFYIQAGNSYSRLAHVHDVTACNQDQLQLLMNVLELMTQYVPWITYFHQVIEKLYSASEEAKVYSHYILSMSFRHFIVHL